MGFDSWVTESLKPLVNTQGLIVFRKKVVFKFVFQILCKEGFL